MEYILNMVEIQKVINTNEKQAFLPETPINPAKS